MSNKAATRLISHNLPQHMARQPHPEHADHIFRITPLPAPGEGINPTIRRKYPTPVPGGHLGQDKNKKPATVYL